MYKVLDVQILFRMKKAQFSFFFFFAGFFLFPQPEKEKMLFSLFHPCFTLSFGRRGGLVVSALDSGSKDPGSSLGRVIVLCSWVRHFTLTVPLSAKEYKWIPANCQGNLTKCWDYLRWNSIPFRRSSKIPSHFMLWKPG